MAFDKNKSLLLKENLTYTIVPIVKSHFYFEYSMF